MRIRLNRFTALLLLLLLAPIVIPLKLLKRLTGSDKKPEYSSTIECDPLTYTGDRPLVVALWATWATVWKVSTAQIIHEVKNEFAGRCEFIYVEGIDRSIGAKYGVKVLPAVLVFHGGKEVARFINLLNADELRQAIHDIAGAEQDAGKDRRINCWRKFSD